MNQLIEVRQVYNVNYDESSPEFQEALAGYRECIDSTADADDMAKKAVWNVAKYGAERMIEGIGYVEMEGTIWGEPYSGISMEEHLEEVSHY